MRGRSVEKISILMAVHHPDRKWLVEQLSSLEAQTYPDLELLVMDDGPDAPVGREIFQNCLHRIPFRYMIHSANLGTSRTYAELVERADGKYVAFCDQDDRWRPEKLERLHRELSVPGAAAAYCTMSVIDSEGKTLAEDVRKIRKQDRFLSGKRQAPSMFVKNCIYGCTLLLPAATAKDALPLPGGMPYDHWFSLWAAIWGSLIFVDEPLNAYRIHPGNQSRPLRGITCKADYERERIQVLKQRSTSCLHRFEALNLDASAREALCTAARESRDWASARSQWLHRKWSAFPAFFAGRLISPNAFRFELFLPFLPEAVFRLLVKRMGR